MVLSSFQSTNKCIKCTKCTRKLLNAYHTVLSVRCENYVGGVLGTSFDFQNRLQTEQKTKAYDEDKYDTKKHISYNQ